jgi:hypothetical protein
MLGEVLEQEVEFARAGRLLAGHEGEVAGGLAQAQEQLQGLDGVEAGGEAAGELGVGGEAQAVVDGALLRVEGAAKDQVGARRELAGDLGLAAAQHEGADLGLQLGGGARLAGLDAAGVAGDEVLAPAEQAGVAEVREAPQLGAGGSRPGCR